jgi:hypothetical protein
MQDSASAIDKKKIVDSLPHRAENPDKRLGFTCGIPNFSQASVPIHSQKVRFITSDAVGSKLSGKAKSKSL